MAYKYPLLLCLVVGLLLPTAASAGDVEAGRAKSQSCVVCHGRYGVSSMPNAPHIAGQPEIYVVEQLKAYRSGKRQHEVMKVAVQNLSDEDIDNLAAWYASIAFEIKPPE